MGKNELQGINQVKLPTVEDKKSDLKYINETFQIGRTVEQIHTMMSEVIRQGYDAKNVNAACNCIQQLNQIINTTISATKFLRGNQ